MTGTLEIDICASGNRSTAMAELLPTAGFDAWSVARETNARARSGRRTGGELR